MLRPSATVAIASLLFALFSLSACKTIYTDTYRSKKNYFKPEKETPRPAEVLPSMTPTEGAPDAAGAAPSLDLLPAADPAPAADAAPEPVPTLTIPGL